MSILFYSTVQMFVSFTYNLTTGAVDLNLEICFTVLNFKTGNNLILLIKQRPSTVKCSATMFFLY